MEDRRLQAVPDIQNGMRSCDLVRKYRISRVTLSRWRHALEGGSDLKSHKAVGRPPRMNSSQEAAVIEMFYAGPWLGAGIATGDARFQVDHWTTGLMALGVQLVLGIRFSDDHMGRLMHRMGLGVGTRGGKRKRAGGFNASTVNENPPTAAPLF